MRNGSMKEVAHNHNEAELGLSGQFRVDEACLRFERAWKEGQRPRIEDYLEAAPEEERAPFLWDLLILELVYRKRASEAVVVEEYRQRFAEQHEVIDDVFLRVSSDWPRLDGSIALSPSCVLADQHRQFLPAMQMLAELGHSIASGEKVAMLPTEGHAAELGELGDFRILREVGRGGMGIVYEAVQISLNRRVALKVLPFAAAMDPKQLQRFKNEAQAAAHLQHRNIVPVHCVGCERGVHFYAMQYINGQTVAAVIRELQRNVEGPMTNDEGMTNDQSQSPQDPAPGANAQTDVRHSTLDILSSFGVRHSSFFRTVANLGLQAAEALEHAHQLGIIHRDIKPANLLIEWRAGTVNCPVLWITDFGLAHCRSQPGLTKTGDLLGTLCYMSPEQALAKRVALDARTDVYSLGVTLYELLTLEPAYHGSDREEILQQIAFSEPRCPRRLNPAIPAELETIVLKAMAKSPEERYLTAQELADDLRRFLEDKPIKARRPSLLQRAAKWTRRHRTVVRAAVAMMVLAVLGLAMSTALIWQSLERERLTSYYERIALAEREWSANNLSRVEQLLDACPANLRGWEWYYLKRLRLQRIPPLTHSSAVLGVALSPDSRWIASGTLDGTVIIWDANTGQKRFAFAAHGRHVRSLAFSPDGRFLATASWDGTAKVWRFDPEHARIENYPVYTLRGHPDRVMNVAFSPDGQHLASAGDDKTLRVWDLATGQEIPHLRGRISRGWCLAYSPDGQSLASAGDEKTLRICDVRTGQEKHTLRGHSAPVLTVAFSRDGQWLASASGDFGTKADGEVILWNARTGREVMTLRGHIWWITSVMFSPDGRRLASAGVDGNVKLWDLATGQEVLTLRGHTGMVHSMTSAATDTSSSRPAATAPCASGMPRPWRGR
jgi:serine/threonine protein kinase